MLFNSFFFTLVFLPLCLAGWFGLNKLNRKAADLFMILMSLWFYGSFSVIFPVILMISVLAGYLISFFAARNEGNKTAERLLMAAGLILNLGLLCFYKYAPTQTLQEIMKGSTAIIPVGLSFYTFSQISFIIDRCRGEIEHDSFLNYVLYVTWFPKLAEGPITRYNEVMPQFADESNRQFCPENFAIGLNQFIFGMAKKILIADNLAAAAAYGYQNVLLSDTLMVVVTTSAYALQLYFDFSGFCDMAAGIARMFNIRLPLNFDSPYKTVSFNKFWQKWHMSLSRFFTKYVYIPLGGSRRGKVRTCINVMIVFILSGIWHGSGMTYIAWGVLTGLFVIAGNLWFKKSFDREMSGPAVFLLRLWNFFVFCFTMIFFGSPNMEYAKEMLCALFRPKWPGIFNRAAAMISMKEFYPLEKAVSLAAPSLSGMLKNVEFGGLLIAALAICFFAPNALELAENQPRSKKNAILMGILAVWCFISMSGVSTYLYFQF